MQNGVLISILKPIAKTGKILYNILDKGKTSVLVYVIASK